MLEFANEGSTRGKPVTHPAAQSFRKELRAALAKIADGDYLTEREIAGFEARVHRHLHLNPHHFDRKALAWLYEHKYESWYPIFSHDILVIYGKRHSNHLRFPGDLRRCQRCDRFYFVSLRREDERRDNPSSTLGRPSKYCSAKCMLAVNAEGAPERLRKFRHPEEANK